MRIQIPLGVFCLHTSKTFQIEVRKVYAIEALKISCRDVAHAISQRERNASMLYRIQDMTSTAVHLCLYIKSGSG